MRHGDAGCPGCGSSPDELVKESLQCWEEAAEVLESIQDQDSAQAAQPRLQALVKRMSELLGVDTPPGLSPWARVSHLAERPGAQAAYFVASVAAERLRDQLGPPWTWRAWLDDNVFRHGLDAPLVPLLQAGS